MDIITKDLHLNTKGFSDIHNLTPKVDSIVKETGFIDGFCHIFVVGSTASISTMEFEPALVKDIKEKLEDFASQHMKSHHSETWEMTTGFLIYELHLWGRVLPFQSGMGDVYWEPGNRSLCSIMIINPENAM